MPKLWWFPAKTLGSVNGMKVVHPSSHFEVEATGESSGKCDCCGNDSRSVWGFVHEVDGPTVAAYFMHWTIGHLNDAGANLDLVLGSWGDGTTSKERYCVSLVHRDQENGSPSLMVIDAAGRLIGAGTLAATTLGRSDVIGTPLAPQVFSIVDAIYEQDDRFF